MIINDIKIGKIDLPLIKTYRKARRIIDTPEEIVIKVVADTGEIGIGSAAATASITGDIECSIINAIKYIKPQLIGKDIDNLEGLMKIIDNSIVNNSSAKAALDMAIYDLFGKKYGIALYKLFGGYKTNLITDLTIYYGTVEEMVTKSLEAIMQGYTHLKIKASSDIEASLERIIAIKKAVRKGIKIRIDANQSWRPKEAVKTIRKLEDMGLDIEFVEQPVKAWDLEGLKYVTDNVETNILADESVFGPPEAFKIIKDRSADLINIKLMKCGGFHNAIKICNMAETMGIKCMMGCMLESKIGITAAASLAVAKVNMTKADLDTMILFKEDSIVGGAIVDGNQITVVDEPGLGIKEIKGWQETL
ncbi:L-Ala-D/L-Glu epimerase [Clostridium tepidiprofundi DSM 19306]|uniref:Dipeptide epimerase n=1 Tax=Clostridium tepidiprofundi DSM 19306 TaxID=1121338 RepID=A0A151B0G5_9CLOT|nr:dipeptide epimerase [Clostridium tepidiprofundi]KYH33273.1 L-Ala-D/L-Glu epimerase [Clostridium tepidiprofundi DSM 19306]